MLAGCDGGSKSLGPAARSIPEHDQRAEHTGGYEAPGQRGTVCLLDLVIHSDLPLSDIPRLGYDVDAAVGRDERVGKVHAAIRTMIVDEDHGSSAGVSAM